MNAWLQWKKNNLWDRAAAIKKRPPIKKQKRPSLDCEACYVLGYCCLCELNIVLAFVRGNTVHAQALRTSGDKKNERDLTSFFFSLPTFSFPLPVVIVPSRLLDSESRNWSAKEKQQRPNHNIPVNRFTSSVVKIFRGAIIFIELASLHTARGKKGGIWICWIC